MYPPPFLPGACTPCDSQLGGLSPLVAPSLSGSIYENNFPHSEGCPLMDTSPFPPELEPPSRHSIVGGVPLLGPSLSGFINGKYIPHSEGCPLMDTPPLSSGAGTPSRPPYSGPVVVVLGPSASQECKLIFPPFRRVAADGPTPFPPRSLHPL